ERLPAPYLRPSLMPPEQAEAGQNSESSGRKASPKTSSFGAPWRTAENPVRSPATPPDLGGTSSAKAGAAPPGRARPPGAGAGAAGASRSATSKSRVGSSEGAAGETAAPGLGAGAPSPAASGAALSPCPAGPGGTAAAP